MRTDLWYIIGTTSPWRKDKIDQRRELTPCRGCQYDLKTENGLVGHQTPSSMTAQLFRQLVGRDPSDSTQARLIPVIG